MRVLVTGGTGFVGSHLIERLIARGDEVRALVRAGSRREIVENLGAKPVTGDLDDADSLAAACRDCEIVYHSAARVEFVGTEEEFHRTTVAGTQRLLGAALEGGVRRFVQISSCGVYHPDLLTAGVINEFTESPQPPKWFTYARAKHRAEAVVREFCAPPMEWVIVRLGYLYGPRNRTMKTYLEPVMASGIMAIVGDGNNELALIDVRDVVAAIEMAGTCGDAAGKILIAAPNERVTQREYFAAMADGFGLPHVKKTVPYRVAFAAGWIGEYFIHKGPTSAAMRRSSIALTGLPQRIDCSYTQKLLGWEPQIRFANGIRDAFEWYYREYGRPSGASH